MLACLRFFRLRRKTIAKMMAPRRTTPAITPPAMAPTDVLFFFLVLVLDEGGRTSTGSTEVSGKPALVMRVKDTEAALLVVVLAPADVDEPLRYTVSGDSHSMYDDH